MSESKVMYLLRYYDWYCEGGETRFIFRTLTDAFAYIANFYGNSVDLAQLKEPELTEWVQHPTTYIKVNGGEYGARLELEEVQVL